tara:strand:+ start:6197 stop:6508 length:312 start_codon:yes stop_codon:yes gene_type:complete
LLNAIFSQNIHSSRLRGKGFKRELDFEEIRRITNLDLSDRPHLINCKNYFVFSFYARGMNFADMMCLEWKDVEANVIYYTRAKTKGNFSTATNFYRIPFFTTF